MREFFYGIETSREWRWRYFGAMHRHEWLNGMAHQDAPLILIYVYNNGILSHQGYVMWTGASLNTFSRISAINLVYVSYLWSVTNILVNLKVIKVNKAYL